MEHNDTRDGEQADVPLDFSDFFHSFGTHLKTYGQREREYLTAKGIERTATMLGGAIPMVACALFATLAVMLGLFAAAKAWGQYLGNEALGYACTAACLVGAAVLLQLLSKPIGQTLRGAIAKAMFAGTDDYTGLATDEHVRRLKAARDEEEEQLTEHLKALKEPEVRGVLLRDAVHDALRTTGPFKFVSGLLNRWNR